MGEFRFVKDAMWLTVRRRAQEAREALRSGLDQVRLLQQQAQQVPQLQAGIVQLEAQLLQYR